MDTAIGQRLKSSPSRLATASVAAALIVAADFAIVWWNHPERDLTRGALAILALVTHLILVEGDLPSAGLRLTPVQGWWFWVRGGLWIGLAVAVLFVVGMGAWVLSGHQMPIYTTAPRDIGPELLRACVSYPVLEEVLYRFALCLPLAALGPWKSIATSGVAFAALHVVYGNPSPENLAGGFFLAWAYLKSESLAMPVLLHSLGNLVALLTQVAAWYWLASA